MKLIFANRNYSSWSLRAWLVLRHFNIPFDEELVLLNGEGWQQNLRKKSPSGKVPVLVDGDVVLRLSADTTVTIRDMQLSQLDMGDFVF